MRLTLRTLLAYLDDTLEPGEIKQIGQKVAESDTAQELVARIKQVTRRRRLTVPPDGGADERFDANRVAAYLDNDLEGEEVTDLEKVCLESDVHLAEIAASHQILTLVLGEPALVPPTARRRMYGLITGRTPKASARPTPAPAVRPTAPTAAVPEADPDDSLMALPLFRKLPWLRWALPLAAVVLLLVLGVVLFIQPGSDDRRTRRPGDSNGEGDPRANTTTTTTLPPLRPTTTNTAPPPLATTPPPVATTPATTTTGPVIPPANQEPSKERHRVGDFDSKDKVLLRKTGDNWSRVMFADPAVYSGEQLVSLPGYRSLIKLDRKLDMELWGAVPELLATPLPLLDSSVTLYHTPPNGLDADVRLHRGRVYFTNKKEKEPTRLRLRFWREEVWDVTFEEPDTVIGVELMSLYVPELKPREGEEPLVQVYLFVLRGSIALKSDRRTWGNLRGDRSALVLWNNKGRGVETQNVGARVALWEADQPGPREPAKVASFQQMTAALAELANALSDREKRVSVALLELLDDRNPMKRVLGTRCLGSIDSVKELIDALGKEDLNRTDVRQEALFTLMNWLTRGKEQGLELFNREKKTGLLLERGYNETEAGTILDLLYPATTEDRAQREFYSALVSYLRHRRVIIRDLAHYHLVALTGNRFRIEYNPVGPVDQRDKGYAEWKSLLDMNKLPPGPAPAPPMPK